MPLIILIDCFLIFTTIIVCNDRSVNLHVFSLLIE